jgi:acyl-CoA thioesterase
MDGGHSEFDEATRLSGGEPAFTAEITGKWSGMAGVNGGYMLALLTRAMGRVAPFPDPIVVSAFYLRPGSPGRARIRTELIRAGRTTAFAQAGLWRDGKETVRATAAFTDLDKAGASGQPAFTGGTAPSLPPPEECLPLMAGAVPGVSIADRIEYRAMEEPGWFRGQPSGNPSAEFYMRFRDGREPDMVSLPLFADAAAPVALEVTGLSTTVELTVHLRARPAPGWLACRAVTRYVAGGYHEEDFEIWDSAGVLVAQSRQLAMVLLPRSRRHPVPAGTPFPPPIRREYPHAAAAPRRRGIPGGPRPGARA